MSKRFVKLRGCLHVLISETQHAHIRSLIATNKRNELAATARGEVLSDEQIKSNRDGEMFEFFRAFIDYHAEPMEQKIQIDDLSKHKQVSLALMKHVYNERIIDFDLFWRKVCNNQVIIDGVKDVHKDIMDAGKSFGIVFNGKKDGVEKEGGLFFMMLFVVASISVAVTRNHALMWDVTDVEQFFVGSKNNNSGLFYHDNFAIRVGMEKASADELPFLTAAANVMVYSITSKMITKQSSKSRMLALVERLVCKKRRTSGGASTPPYHRLCIVCYSILGYFFRDLSYIPPTSRQAKESAKTQKPPEEKVDSSNVYPLSVEMVSRLRPPVYDTAQFIGEFLFAAIFACINFILRLAFAFIASL